MDLELNFVVPLIKVYHGNPIYRRSDSNCDVDTKVESLSRAQAKCNVDLKLEYIFHLLKVSPKDARDATAKIFNYTVKLITKADYLENIEKEFCKKLNSYQREFEIFQKENLRKSHQLTSLKEDEA